ncbi:MAG: tyrosine--tRNA ligase [Thermodesulfobacteriota bacterium]
MSINNPYQILLERGFVYQCTDEEGLSRIFDKEKVTAYIGFDATADSLHVGSLIPIMALAWLQKTGHRPIAIVGGGTTMVGDPSGKTEARQLLSRDDIRRNMEGLKKQLSRYLEFGPDQALMVDNGDWLLGLNYIDFLREIGRYFSVNRMLAAESYKQRLETGLTFIEFNYMLLQSYDFLVLYQNYGNKLQMGGQDQWGNIVAGIDLIRRVTGGQAYGLTFPLLEDPRTGSKFGKTHAGAVWLDPEKTTPYDFYQFWRNTDDQLVERCLKLFTFLPLDQVRELNALEGAGINQAKEMLAYEATKLTHGREEAEKARQAAKGLFAAAGEVGGEDEFPVSSEAIPSTEISAEVLARPANVLDLLVLSGLVKSKGEARKLIRGGGANVNGRLVDQEERSYNRADLKDGAFLLRAGKKRYHRLIIKD